MPRKPIEIPPAGARAFVKDMRAFHAAKTGMERDEVAARPLHALQEHLLAFCNLHRCCGFSDGWLAVADLLDRQPIDLAASQQEQDGAGAFRAAGSRRWCPTVRGAGWQKEPITEKVPEQIRQQIHLVYFRGSSFCLTSDHPPLMERMP